MEPDEYLDLETRTNIAYEKFNVWYEAGNVGLAGQNNQKLDVIVKRDDVYESDAVSGALAELINEH